MIFGRLGPTDQRNKARRAVVESSIIVAVN